MKRLLYLFILVLCFVEQVVGQTYNTSVKVADVIDNFKSKDHLQWAIPISQTERLSVDWQQRNTSFSQTENIRTFVGYYQKNLVGVIALHSGKITGTIRWENTEINLQTSDDGFLTLQKETSDKQCGTCTHTSCQTHHTPAMAATRKSAKSPTARPATEQTQKYILDDGVLRVYRLALPIANSFYTEVMKSKMENVMAFWATAEAGLNEIYVRDLGVKFQVIQDSKLVITTSDQEFFGSNGPRAILSSGTRKLNEVIGEANYDMGLFLALHTGINVGEAYIDYGYFKDDKAAAVSKVASVHIIAHELGHLFGASHVHTKIGGNTSSSHKTEIDYGQSVMGYGQPQNFFSLVTIEDIRSELFALPYYTDATKTTQVGEKTIAPAYDNFPIGIKTNNKAPIIHRDKLQETYLLPKETPFQFRFNATDPEADPVLYMAHQVDKAIQGKSRAKFYTHNPSEKNHIFFQEEYGAGGFLERPLNTVVNDTYTFWLGASDGKDAHLREHHATRYDIFQTKVKIVNAKPFKITKGNAYSYKKGERVTLRWDVDETLFKDTKVRIWLSDDFGQTFKYLLEASADNDGECEVVLPQIEIGKINYKNGIGQVRAGVFKIEVIDHIAYALSALNPTNGRGQFTGGFLVEDSQITFTDTPEAVVHLKETDAIPQKHDVKASTQCSRGLKGAISYEETDQTLDNQRLITRIWTAEDYCGTKSSWVQRIFITKEEEKLPPTDEEDNSTDGGSNSTDEGNNSTDEGNNSTGEGNNSTGEGNNSTDGESVSQDEIIVYNAVSADFGSENYLKIENSEQFRALHIEIYNELGQKVYQSKSYGQKGEVFRGYSNVSGVVGKGKRLPSGTYFYILKYQTSQGNNQSKKGYLFVK